MCVHATCVHVMCVDAEEPFELDGPSGMLAYLQQLLDERGHAVICVSEGAGQNLLYPGGARHWHALTVQCLPEIRAARCGF